MSEQNKAWMANRTGCKGCAYLGTTYGSPSCDYLFKTGKLRPCPGGAECTVHTKKRRERSRDAIPQSGGPDTQREKKRTKWDMGEARRLYDKGYSDARIGKELGVSTETVRKWRKQGGLKNLKEKCGEKSKVPMDEKKALELYRAGMHDTEIAEALGVPPSRVQSWRYHNGFNGPRARDEKKIQEEEEKGMKKETAKKEAETAQEEAVTEQATITAAEPTLITREEAPAAPQKASEAQKATHEGGQDAVTVRSLCAIAQRLLDFGMGEARVSIGGKPLKDFRHVTVDLGEEHVEIDLT